MRYFDLDKKHQCELLESISQGTPCTTNTIERVLVLINPLLYDSNTGVFWIHNNSWIEFLNALILDFNS